jgi:hypothetical protein
MLTYAPSSGEGARSSNATRSVDETRLSAEQGLQGLQVSMLYLGPMEKLLHLNAVLAQQARMLTYAHVCSRMLTYAHVC